MNRPLPPDELERLIHRELRALPARRAPRTLESRVLAALEQRTALPWYRQGWSYWPATVRAAFLATGTGLGGTVIAAYYRFSQGTAGAALTQEVDSRFAIFRQLLAAGNWVVNFAGHLLAGIPPLWLYGGLATVAAFYVTFFGLGAVAYRTLYQHD